MRTNLPGALLWAGLVLQCLLVLAGAGEAGVVLELKNGDRLSGLILSENTNRLVLSNAWSGALTVPTGQILKRHPQTPPRAEAEPVLGSDAAVATQLGILLPAQAKVPAAKHWTLDSELGASLLYSTKTCETFYGRAKYNYSKDRVRAALDYIVNYGRTDGEVDANNMSLIGKTDLDMTKRWFFYNLAGAGYDEVRRIELSYEVGPGVGYHLIQSEPLKVNIETGFDYQFEDRADDTTRINFSTRIAENAVWNVAKRVSLEQRFEYFPRVDDIAQYRYRFEATVRLWLTTHLSLNFSVFDIFDTNPASDVRENDLQVRSAIGVKF